MAVGVTGVRPTRRARPSLIRPGSSAARPARAVFLDRDGVLNRAFVREGHPYPPARVDDLEVLPGVTAAVERLREAGYRTIVVTTQPDTASRSTVDEINRGLRSVVPVDEVLVCPHDDAEGDGDACGCVLVDAAERLGIDLSASVMVGDRGRDVEAGRRAGCRTVFVDRGYDEPHPDHSDAQVPDLPAAVAWILHHPTP